MQEILLTSLNDTLAFANKIPDKYAGYRHFIVHHTWQLLNKFCRR